jgi:hypothetical protein
MPNYIIAQKYLFKKEAFSIIEGALIVVSISQLVIIEQDMVRNIRGSIKRDAASLIYIKSCLAN